MGNVLNRYRRRNAREERVSSKTSFMRFPITKCCIDKNKTREVPCIYRKDSTNCPTYVHSCDDVVRQDGIDIVSFGSFPKLNTSLLDDHDTTTICSYPFDEIDSLISECDDYFNKKFMETVPKCDGKDFKTTTSDMSPYRKLRNASFQKSNGTKSYDNKESYSDLDSFTKFLGSFLDFGDQNIQGKHELSMVLFPDDQFFQCDWTLIPCPSLSRTSSFSSDSSTPLTPIRTIPKRDLSTQQRTTANKRVPRHQDIMSNGTVCCSDEMMFVSNSFDEALWSMFRTYDDYCYEEKDIGNSNKQSQITACPIKTILKEHHENNYCYENEDLLAPSDEEDERMIQRLNSGEGRKTRS